jgi:hypothetical protein
LKRALVLTLVALVLFIGVQGASAANTLPNLVVAQISPSTDSETGIFPQVNQTFYMYVVVVNSGGTGVSAPFGLMVNLTVAEYGGPERNITFGLHYLHGLDAGQSSEYVQYSGAGSSDPRLFGPIVVPRPSNLTVIATVNPSHVVAESNYSDNTLKSTFAVGELFPSTTVLTSNRIWQEKEPVSFQYSSQYSSGTYDNRLQVRASESGGAVAIQSDASHIMLYKNGTKVLDVQYSQSDFPNAAISRAGTYLAIETQTNLSVYDIKGKNASLIYSTKLGKSELDFDQVAVSNDGLVAVAYFGNTNTTTPLSNYSFGYVKVIDGGKGKVLWEANLDRYFPLAGQYLTTSARSLDFDNADDLLIGVSVGFWTDAFPVSRTYDLNPWLYLFDSEGRVTWRGFLNFYVNTASISGDGGSVVAGTGDGYVHFFRRTTNATHEWFEGFALSSAKSSLFSSYLPVAVSPEGDCVAISDTANVYLLDPYGSPLFKIPLPQVTSLALGGGVLVAGTLGGTVTVSLWGPVDEAITQGQNAINVARAGGRNVTDAQSRLTSALSSKQAGHWLQAYSEALRSISSAQQAPMVMTEVSATSVAANTISSPAGNLEISGILPLVGVIVIVAVAVVVLLLWKKRR